MINYQRLYEYRFRNVDQARRELVWGAIAPMIYEWLGQPERILDPAAGRCEFLNAVPSRERWGVDAVKYAEGRSVMEGGGSFPISCRLICRVLTSMASSYRTS